MQQQKKILKEVHIKTNITLNKKNLQIEYRI